MTNNMCQTNTFSVMRNSPKPFRMNTYLVVLAVLVVIATTSCTPAKKEAKPAEVQQQIPEPQGIAQPAASPAISPATATVPAPAAVGAPAPVSAAATPPKLNPAHGQPFHRCDIPVGSPLNAAPAKPVTTGITTGISTGGAPTLENAGRLNNSQVNNRPVTNTQVANPTAPTVVNASGTPPKLNPPHGQPFHKCEIPVGSPLN